MPLMPMFLFMRVAYAAISKEEEGRAARTWGSNGGGSDGGGNGGGLTYAATLFAY